MLWKIFKTLSLCVIIFLCGAQAFSDDTDIITIANEDTQKIAKALKNCTPNKAEKIHFGDLFDRTIDPFRANPDYQYKCVKFDGIASWRRVYKDSHSSYKISQFGSYRANTNIREHIGLSGHDVMRKEKLHKRSLSGELTGVLSTCGFTMSGYCHYESGPHLVLKSVRNKKRPEAFRYLGQDAVDEYGNLREIEIEVARKSGLVEAFDKWISAIAKKDKESFYYIAGLAGYGPNTNLHNETYKTANSKEDIDLFYQGLWEAFFSEKTAYNQIEALNFGDYRYFSSTRLLSSEGELLDVPADKDTYACLCLEEDCTDRWPISSRDAGINKSYPYICRRFWPKGKYWGAHLPQVTLDIKISEIKLNSSK